MREEVGLWKVRFISGKSGQERQALTSHHPRFLACDVAGTFSQHGLFSETYARSVANIHCGNAYLHDFSDDSS